MLSRARSPERVVAALFTPVADRRSDLGQRPPGPSICEGSTAICHLRRQPTRPTGLASCRQPGAVPRPQSGAPGTSAPMRVNQLTDETLRSLSEVEADEPVVVSAFLALDPAEFAGPPLGRAE